MENGATTLGKDLTDLFKISVYLMIIPLLGDYSKETNTLVIKISWKNVYNSVAYNVKDWKELKCL